jgi:hypothetical protein
MEFVGRNSGFQNHLQSVFPSSIGSKPNANDDAYDDAKDDAKGQDEEIQNGQGKSHQTRHGEMFGQ